MAPLPTAAGPLQHTARSQRPLVKRQPPPTSSRLRRPTVLERPSTLEGLKSAGRQPRHMIMAIPTGMSGAAFPPWAHALINHVSCLKYGNAVIRGVEGDLSTVSYLSSFIVWLKFTGLESHWRVLPEPPTAVIFLAGKFWLLWQQQSQKTF